MTNEELILKIAECDAVDSLPPELRAEVLAVKKRVDGFKEEMRAAEEKERLERAQELKRDRKRLLCSGEWGEKVPRNRRFALCKQVNTYRGVARNETYDRVDYCAVDLVRGYMSPYFGYYGVEGQKQMDAFYNERIRPVLETKSEDELIKILRSEWDTFKINNTREASKFQVIDYEVEKGTGYRFGYFDWKKEPTDKVVMLGESSLMTWEEHRDALKKEFK